MQNYTDMGHEATKLELIEWLTKLENEEIIGYLKVVKDSNTLGSVDALTDDQEHQLNLSFNEFKRGKKISHQEVIKKYGL